MRLVGFAVAVCLLAACTDGDGTGSAYLIKKLKDPNTRTTALKELGKTGDKTAAPELVKWLETPGSWQVDAAWALGQLGEPSVAQKLLAAASFAIDASDKQAAHKTRLNQAIAEALGNLKAEGAVDQLSLLLNAADARTRTATAVALGKIGSHAATDSLIKAGDTDTDGTVRKAVAEALGNLADPKAVPQLVKMLYVELPGTSFYYEAHFALQQIGAAAVPLLLETLQRKNKMVEDIRMRDGLPISDGAVEAKAASVLGQLRAKETAPAMLAALDKYLKAFQKNPDEPVAPAAVMELCGALADIGDKTAVKSLLPVAAIPDGDLRTAASDALSVLGDRSAVAQLLKAATTGSDEAREPAMAAAARLGAETDLKAFDALAAATTKEVTKEMLDKLVQKHRPRLLAAGECKMDMACWSKKLKDNEWTVRERAAFELGWAASKEAEAALLEAAEKDTRIEVRSAAVNALSRLPSVSPDKLQAIHDKWAKDMDNRDVNVELRRLIVRAKHAKA